MKVQVKAGELSGRELDRWVSRVIGLFMESALSMDALSRQTSQLTYDRRWDAVGYLMQKFNIGLAPPLPPSRCGPLTNKFLAPCSAATMQSWPCCAAWW